MNEQQRPDVQGQKLFSHLLASRPPRERKATAAATLVSLFFHACVVAGAVWATLKMAQASEGEEEVTYVELAEEPPPPPPPPPPPEVVTPPPQTMDEPRGFQTLTIPEIVPPDIPPPGFEETRETDFSGEGVEGGKGDGKVVNLDAAPVITPYTVAPEVTNREEVVRALLRLYPPMLRDAGVGGTVILWFLIDEEGRVLKTQLKTSSGHESLDHAAAEVAKVMRFSPAYNMDRRVKVWVQVPVRFSIR